MLQWKGSGILLPFVLALESQQGQGTELLALLPWSKEGTEIYFIGCLLRSHNHFPLSFNTPFIVSIVNCMETQSFLLMIDNRHVMALSVTLGNREVQYKSWWTCSSLSIFLLGDIKATLGVSVSLWRGVCVTLFKILEKYLHFNELNFTKENQPFVCKTMETYNLFLGFCTYDGLLHFDKQPGKHLSALHVVQMRHKIQRLLENTSIKYLIISWLLLTILVLMWNHILSLVLTKHLTAKGKYIHLKLQIYTMYWNPLKWPFSHCKGEMISFYESLVASPE